MAVSSEPGFWERADAQEISRELAQLQGRRDGWLEMDAEIRELDLLAELYAESEDRDLFSEFYERAKQFEKRMEEFGKHRNFGRPDFNKMKDMPPRPQEGAPMPPPRDERGLIQNLKSD